MTTYYVDASRPDNSGDGLTQGTAKQTLAAGLALVTAAGDILELAAGTCTLTSLATLTTSGTAASYVTIRGAAGGARPVITSSTTLINLLALAANYVKVEHLKFTHTGATRGYAIAPTVAERSGHWIYDCEFDGVLAAYAGWYFGEFACNDLIMQKCHVHHCTNTAIQNARGTNLIDCDVVDNTGAAYSRAYQSGQYLAASGCNFARNSNNAFGDVPQGVQSRMSFDRCVFRNHNPGIAVNANEGVFTFNRCIFYGNQTAINFTTALRVSGGYNAFGANGTNRVNCPVLPGDIILTADPHVNAAANDFSLNDAAGGGALLRDVSRTNPAGVAASHDSVGSYQLGTGPTYLVLRS